MSLLFIAPKRNMSTWKEAATKADPNIDVEIWPEVQNKEQVQFAVCWNHPKYVLDQYPNLKVVSSLGAGVDHLLSDESLSDSVELCRIVSPSLVQQMKEYVLAAVLNIQRNFVKYIRQRDQRKLQTHHHSLAKNVHIGVMGLGELGEPVATQLVQMGYRVSGWSRSKKQIDGVKTFVGANELGSFLSNTQILICLLPLTSQTEGILNLALFKKLKPSAWIINVARGQHLVDEDLIYALDSNMLQGAWLDVFSEEPLPERHPFWNRSNIIITPHIASITPPGEAVPQIIDNYKRALSGIDLLHSVDRGKGY